MKRIYKDENIRIINTRWHRYVLENDKALVVLGRCPGNNDATFETIADVCHSVLIKELHTSCFNTS